MKPRCPKCKKRMVALLVQPDKYVCIRCEPVDPIETEAAKWASGALVPPK
jgi:hypothetical protein